MEVINYFKILYLLEVTKLKLIEKFKERWLSDFKFEWDISHCKESGTKIMNSITDLNNFNQESYQLVSQGDINKWDSQILSNILISYPWKTINKDNLDFENDLFIDIRNIYSKINEFKKRKICNVNNSDYDYIFNGLQKPLILFGIFDDNIDFSKDLEIVNENISKEEKDANQLKEIGNKWFNKRYYLEAIKSYSKAINTIEGISFYCLSILYSNRSKSYFEEYKRFFSPDNNNKVMDSRTKDYLVQARKDALVACKLRPYWSKNYFRLSNIYSLKAKNGNNNKLMKASKYIEVARFIEPNNNEIIKDQHEINMKFQEVYVKMGYSVNTELIGAMIKSTSTNSFTKIFLECPDYYHDRDTLIDYLQMKTHAKYSDSLVAKRICQSLDLFQQFKGKVLAGSSQKLNSPKDYDIALRLLADAFRIEEYAVQLKESSRVASLSIIDFILKQEPNHKDARLCYLYIHLSLNRNLEDLLNFVTQSIKYHPEDKDFYFVRSQILLLLGNSLGSLNDINLCIKLDTMDHHYHYHRAVSARLLIKLPEDENSFSYEDIKTSVEYAIECYETYLKYAPKDDRKVPESYYSAAMLYKLSNSPTVEKYMSLGLESEKVQLFPYMPYRSSSKEFMIFLLQGKKDDDLFDKISKLNSVLYNK